MGKYSRDEYAQVELIMTWSSRANFGQVRPSIANYGPSCPIMSMVSMVKFGRMS